MRPVESNVVPLCDPEWLTEIRVRVLVRQIIDLMDENDVLLDEVAVLKQRIAALEVTP